MLDSRASTTVDQPYDDLIMDHIRHARNYRVPVDASGKASGLNPLCGDELTVYVRIERGVICDAAFQCSCCGVSMASASMMTEIVKGRSAAEARFRARTLVALLYAPRLSLAAPGDEMLRALLATVRQFPARARCAALPWTTLEAALESRPAAAFHP